MQFAEYYTRVMIYLDDNWNNNYEFSCPKKYKSVRIWLANYTTNLLITSGESPNSF